MILGLEDYTYYFDKLKIVVQLFLLIFTLLKISCVLEVPKDLKIISKLIHGNCCSIIRTNSLNQRPVPKKGPCNGLNYYLVISFMCQYIIPRTVYVTRTAQPGYPNYKIYLKELKNICCKNILSTPSQYQYRDTRPSDLALCTTRTRVNCGEFPSHQNAFFSCSFHPQYLTLLLFLFAFM